MYWKTGLDRFLYPFYVFWVIILVLEPRFGSFLLPFFSFLRVVWGYEVVPEVLWWTTLFSEILFFFFKFVLKLDVEVCPKNDVEWRIVIWIFVLFGGPEGFLMLFLRAPEGGSQGRNRFDGCQKNVQKKMQEREIDLVIYHFFFVC